MVENLKQCPFCGEYIIESAKKCKHCKQWLIPKPGVSPTVSAQRPGPTPKPNDTEDTEPRVLSEDIKGIAQISFFIAITGALLYSLAVCPYISRDLHGGGKFRFVFFVLSLVQSIGINATIASIIEAVGAVGLWYGVMKRLEIIGRPQTVFVILSIALSLFGIIEDVEVVDVLILIFSLIEVAFSIVLITKYKGSIKKLGIVLLASIVFGVTSLVIVAFMVEDEEVYKFFFALISFGFSWLQYKYMRDAIKYETY